MSVYDHSEYEAQMAQEIQGQREYDAYMEREYERWLEEQFFNDLFEYDSCVACD